MKRVKFTVIVKYKHGLSKEMKDMKNSILSGEFQRGLKKDKNVIDAKAVFQELN